MYNAGMEKRKNGLVTCAEAVAIGLSTVGLVGVGLIVEGARVVSTSPAAVEAQRAFIEVGGEVFKVLIIVGGVNVVENMLKVVEAHVK